jgi:hypothetical protein
MRRQADNVDVIPAKELAINHGARNIVEGDPPAAIPQLMEVKDKQSWGGPGGISSLAVDRAEMLMAGTHVLNDRNYLMQQRLSPADCQAKFNQYITIFLQF